MSGDEHKSAAARAWHKYAFAAIPAAGLLEFGAHLVQTHSVAPDADWQAAEHEVDALITELGWQVEPDSPARGLLAEDPDSSTDGIRRTRAAPGPVLGGGLHLRGLAPDDRAEHDRQQVRLVVDPLRRRHQQQRARIAADSSRRLGFASASRAAMTQVISPIAISETSRALATATRTTPNESSIAWERLHPEVAGTAADQPLKGIDR